MKQIHRKLFSASLLVGLLFCMSPTYASEAEVNVWSIEKTDTPSKYLSVNISASSGISFVLYLTSSNENSAELLAVLGNYAVPADFPSPGFRLVTDVTIASNESTAGEKKFKREYVTKIIQSPELTVYGIATNSSINYESLAYVENTAFLNGLCGTASSEVTVIRLANWTIKGDPLMSAIQLNLAYAKDVGEPAFNKQLYELTGLHRLSKLSGDPITFFSSKRSSDEQ